MLQTKIVEKRDRHFMPSKIFCISNYLQDNYTKGSELIKNCYTMFTFLNFSNSWSDEIIHLRTRGKNGNPMKSGFTHSKLHFVYFYPTLKLM